MGDYETNTVRPSNLRDGDVQVCPDCREPGYWFGDYYAAPNGHTKRPDGTLGCPLMSGVSIPLDGNVVASGESFAVNHTVNLASD